MVAKKDRVDAHESMEVISVPEEACTIRCPIVTNVQENNKRNNNADIASEVPTTV